MRNLQTKAKFIERTWNVWETELGGRPSWHLTITYFMPGSKRVDYVFVGDTKEKCLYDAAEALDKAVADWAYSPDDNPFGRWLVMEKGWRL